MPNVVHTPAGRALRKVSEADPSSRERFISAAEDQFIVRGYDGCTIRAIAAQAGTSIASLSRNWDSKSHLFEEVFHRHFDRIHRAQQQGFDALEAEGTVSIEAIIEAFFGSAIGRKRHEKSHRVYCLALLDPSEEARSITRVMVEPVRSRLIGLMRRALPGLNETRFFLAMNVLLGVYIYPQAHGARLAGVMSYDIDAVDWADASRILAMQVARGIATQD
ncbi:TetR/AcrR family transcriptional regulator [Sphingomonas sp. AR_OL41]|uniref:TetR/AcrR family transcriptional regulator n=1 Tax=Sphingomonas sp. AR_OL41 TaxID=3042729 RepID=UPI002480AE81|nr:TetR/AcrR family transcriptional regulator [Sphingomonas sp. AR_OL41]MDH7973646.1 TetR/AcrR family transcriptional regulator [Sphingomonas sp. AR_OL41]